MGFPAALARSREALSVARRASTWARSETHRLTSMIPRPVRLIARATEGLIARASRFGGYEISSESPLPGNRSYHDSRALRRASAPMVNPGETEIGPAPSRRPPARLPPRPFPAGIPRDPFPGVPRGLEPVRAHARE